MNAMDGIEVTIVVIGMAGAAVNFVQGQFNETMMLSSVTTIAAFEIGRRKGLEEYIKKKEGKDE